MTDVNGKVTSVAPDPDHAAGEPGERSASLTERQRRKAGLPVDGDVLEPAGGAGSGAPGPDRSVEQQ